MKQNPLNPDILNIDLLIPEPDLFKKMGFKEVTSLAIFEPNSDVFNLTGLFSQDIFGQIGSSERISKFGYVDFKIPVLHPLIFGTILKLGDKYAKILAGKTNAVFNEEEKDFVVDENGETGFNFFLKYLDKIDFKRTDSFKRDNKIALFEKYGRSNALINTFLIIPAGLRDYSVDDKGHPSEDEINPLYRTLIGLANKMRTINITPDTIELIDPIRYKIQTTLHDIYSYIMNLINGKEKFIQSKWASRAIYAATRNVITSIPTRITDLDSDDHVGFNNTVVGLFQYLKAIGPVIYNKIVSRFLMKFMGNEGDGLYLIDKETFRPKKIVLSNKSKQAWTTYDGINNTINKFMQSNVLNELVEIDGCYMAYVIDRGKEIEIIFNFEDLPEDYQAPDILRAAVLTSKAGKYLTENIRFRPITYAELFYLSVVDIVKKFPCLNTRYPITGNGSIYPAYPYLKTTKKSRHVTVYVEGEELDCLEYPIMRMDNPYFRSMAVHYTHLGTLGADHDGDTLNFTILFSKESKAEVDKILETRDFYINSLGGANFSPSNHIIETVIKHMTSD